jgi:RsiW-degrading membrane proteinase PrsW (M82 family)
MMASTPNELAHSTREDLFRPHRAAFWLFFSLLVFGVVKTFTVFSPRVEAYPAATVLAVVLFGAFGVLFFLALRPLDLFRREPATMIAGAVVWGALVAAPLAAIANAAFHNILAKATDPEFALRWAPAFAGPTTEEPLKLMGVIVLAMIAWRQFDSLLSGLFYGALVGLGFQVSEDFAYAVRQLELDRGAESSVVGIFFVRGILTGLFSHTAYTAIAGLGVGYFISRRSSKSFAKRLAVAAGCFATAYAFHFIWNTPLFTSIGTSGAANTLLLMVVDGIPLLIIAFILYRVAYAEERAWFSTAFATYNNPPVMDADEAATLQRFRARRAARAQARKERGRKAVHIAGQIQIAQGQLIHAWSLDHSSPSVSRLEAEILALKAEMAALPRRKGASDVDLA